MNFYYENGATYFGIIFSNGVTNTNDSILFTLSISYDGTSIKKNFINNISDTIPSITKSSNNKYVSFVLTQTSKKTDLAYINVWIVRIN